MVFQSSRIICVFFLVLTVLWTTGCSELEVKKRSIKGPIISDNLTGGELAATVTGGTFTKQGWKPGADGTLVYNLPGMPLGRITVTATGLNRSVQETVFLTLYEPTELDYADPFVLQNPYRITLALKNFQQSPDSPFDWLWTIKSFSQGTPNERRYSSALPQSGQSYQKKVKADRMPIFPDETYKIILEWKNGKAVLQLNRTILAEQQYAPVLFNAQSLRLIVGKSPGLDTFDMGDVTFSNVEVTFPGL